MLPISSRARVATPLETALFTATSAALCYRPYHSGYGPVLVSLRPDGYHRLIQVGGMGVVTMAVVLMMFSGRKIGIKQRWIMQESISAPQVGGIVRMAGMILKTTLLVEGLGALLLALRFCPQFGLGRGLWYAVFHSISAFCNAGFDLMGANGAPFSSLTAYSADWLVSLVIVLLILVGGIGFGTWKDIGDYRMKLKRYRLQTKLILSVTLLLVGGGFLFMLL